MSESKFIPGQRWISDTELNLGLGIVVEQQGRQVVFSFPAAGERRTYALDSAPVSRVAYKEGDLITSETEWTLRVQRVEDVDGCLVYSGIDSEGERRSLHELELSAFVRFNTPQARLFAGQVDHNQRFELRCETLELKSRHQRSGVIGLLGARVQLLPHQIYIANEISERYAPRVLLADEVGLGKTIEAGLIMHKQLISGRAKRVLVLVPENLVHQWLVEMLRRFNLHFTILDGDRCQALSGEMNPFDSAQLVLSPLNFVVEDEKARSLAADSEWDLLVVDEAHHLVWEENHASAGYTCVEQLAFVAKGLLLLTATPEQLGVESHFARLRLLDPDRYYDLEAFRAEEARYQQVNEVVRELLAWRDGTVAADVSAEQSDSRANIRWQALQDRLAGYLGEEAAGSLFSAPEGDQSQVTEQKVQALISALLDCHGTGRVLFRNTRGNVDGFPQRQLARYPLKLPDSPAFNVDQPPLREQLHPEILMGSDWPEQDRRVSWLKEWLRGRPDKKLVVICALAETAVDLDEYLRRSGFASAAFHEGLDLVARDRAAAYFADPDEGAQLLVCSEIGSEGRNFQFAHHLVLFDLPLNPDLLEQRIGRLDRIGQKHTVTIHVPYYQCSAQARLLDWYDLGLNSLEKNRVAGAAIAELLGDRLIDWLETGQDEGLLEKTCVLAEQYRERLEKGRDRLLEMNSCRMDKATELIQQIDEHQDAQWLSAYMERVFEQFGVEQEKHSELSAVVYPGDHMHCSHFPGLREGGVTVTSDRSLALAREDFQFLTLEHPMVSGAMDMILQEDFGNTTLCTLKLPPLQPGTLLLESIYIVQCQAPVEFQLFRYLPLSSVRVLLDSQNKDLSGVLTSERLATRVQPVKRNIARELVANARLQIEVLIEQSQQFAMQQHQQLIEQARQDMLTLQHLELDRLKQLARINPNIRQQEINQIVQETRALEHYLDHAQLIPDALRIIIAV